MGLSEWFPEWHAQDEWIKANATRFKVSTMGMAEPDYPLIAVSIEAVDQGGTFTRVEAEQRVAELEEAGIAAWFTPTRNEFYRLLKDYEARDAGA